MDGRRKERTFTEKMNVRIRTVTFERTNEETTERQTDLQTEIQKEMQTKNSDETPQNVHFDRKFVEDVIFWWDDSRMEAEMNESRRTHWLESSPTSTYTIV